MTRRKILSQDKIIMNTPSRRAWKILTELILYGFIVRIGQLCAILLAFQFGEIFTNPSQIIFLLPIALIILTALVILTLIEIECNRYMRSLGKRLAIVKKLCGKQLAITKQDFLENIFLSLSLNILSIPILIVFLVWTSPLLSTILITSIAASGLTIHHFNNKKLYQDQALNKFSLKKDDASHEENMLPIYLIKDIESHNFVGMNSSASNHSTSGIDQQKNFSSIEKRKILSLIRQFTRVIILMTSAILAVFNIVSIAKIAGFLIIGNFLRASFISLFEFMTVGNNPFPINESLEILEVAIMTKQELIERAESIHKKLSDESIAFNSKYKQLISNHPFIKFKDLTLKHIQYGTLLEKMTSRVQISPISLILVESNIKANHIRRLLYHKRAGSIGSNYIINGETILGGKKVSRPFYDLLKTRDIFGLNLYSSNIYDYFSPSQAEDLNNFIHSKPELSIFVDELISSMIDITMASPRQINQFKSLVQLLSAYLDQSFISIGVFLLDYFEKEDSHMLIEIFRQAFQANSINLILLSRNETTIQPSMPIYKLTGDSLMRQNGRRVRS